MNDELTQKGEHRLNTVGGEDDEQQMKLIAKARSELTDYFKLRDYFKIKLGINNKTTKQNMGN